MCYNPAWPTIAYDQSQLSDEDKAFIARAAQRSRQAKIRYARAMVPAGLIMILLGFVPVLLVGLFFGVDFKVAGAWLAVVGAIAIAAFRKAGGTGL